SLHKDKSDKTVLAICECQVDNIDGHFTNKQYRKHTSNNIVNVSELIKEDAELEKTMKECFTSSGKTILLQAESFQTEFISQCIKSIQKNTEKKLDENNLTKFCSC